MGTNSIEPNRQSGDAIQVSHVNDLAQALSGDMIGRNSSGNPALAQNLGNNTTPWGTLHCDNIAVGGNTIDNGIFQLKRNRIVGRASRSQTDPIYIDKLNYLRIPESSEDQDACFVSNLRCVINNEIKDFSTFSVENLTLLNSALPILKLDTSSQSYRNIYRGVEQYANLFDVLLDSNTVENRNRISTHFLDLKNRRVAFKMVESSDEAIWTGVVDAENSSISASDFRLSLKDCRSLEYGEDWVEPFWFGYANNTNNFICGPRSEPNIEVLNVGYIFLDFNGTDYEVSYRQPYDCDQDNSGNPLFRFDGETNFVDGQYWHDTNNQVWLRHNGTDWEVTNRILIGECYLDESGCVGVRSLDLDITYKNDSTIKNLKVIKDSDGNLDKVISLNYYNKISVYGNDLEFSQGNLQWVAASDQKMDGANHWPERLYLGIEPSGKLVVASNPPIYNPKLKGHYDTQSTIRYVASLEAVKDTDTRTDPSDNNDDRISQEDPADEKYTEYNIKILDKNFDNLVGSITLSASDLIPENFLLCDGSAIRQQDFPELFERIGWRYGRVFLGPDNAEGDPTKTPNDYFRLPDFRGLFPRGRDFGTSRDEGQDDRTSLGNLNTYSGGLLGSYQVDTLEQHTHNIQRFLDPHSPDSIASFPAIGTAGDGKRADIVTKATQGIDSSTARFSGETRPKNLYINFIIKFR